MWFAGRLRPHVTEIPFLAVAAVETPKAVLNVPFCHEDDRIVLGFRERVNYSLQSVPELIYCPFGCELLRCVVDQGDDAAITKPQREQQVQD